VFPGAAARRLAPAQPSERLGRLGQRRAGQTVPARDPGLEVEEELLPPEPASVAAQLAVLLDHPVAGDDDGDPVLAVRQAHGALRAGPADAPRQLLVGDRLAAGDPEQLLPDPLLKL